MSKSLKKALYLLAHLQTFSEKQLRYPMCEEKKIPAVLGQVLCNEVAADDSKSITRDIAVDLIKNFKHVIDSRAPTLLFLLVSCLKTG